MLSCLFTVLWDGISEKQKEVDKGSVVDEKIPKKKNTVGYLKRRVEFDVERK